MRIDKLEGHYDIDRNGSTKGMYAPLNDELMNKINEIIAYINEHEEACETTLKAEENKYEQALRLLKDYYQTPENWEDYQTLKELVDKTQRKKPVTLGPNYPENRFHVCPKCKCELIYANNTDYCGSCGQHLDWGDIVYGKE